MIQSHSWHRIDRSWVASSDTRSHFSRNFGARGGGEPILGSRGGERMAGLMNDPSRRGVGGVLVDLILVDAPIQGAAIADAIVERLRQNASQRPRTAGHVPGRSTPTTPKPRSTYESPRRERRWPVRCPTPKLPQSRPRTE